MLRCVPEEASYTRPMSGLDQGKRGPAGGGRASHSTEAGTARVEAGAPGAPGDLERLLLRRAQARPQRRIVTCPCGQTLELSAEFHGAALACPSCGAEAPVDDPTAEAPQPGRPQNKDAGAQAILRDPALVAQERAEARQLRRRRIIRTTAAALVLLLIVGGGLIARHYRRQARWVSGGPSVPPIVQRAIRSQVRASHMLENEASGFHRGLYAFTTHWTMSVLSRRPQLRRQLPLVQNELAWFLLTTDDISFHDPVEALPIAEEAVLASQMKRPALIDTYAEALFQNDRIKEAVDAERQAVSLRPKDAFLQGQLEKFERALAAEEASPAEAP